MKSTLQRFVLFLFLLCGFRASSQTPPAYDAADILQQMQKLNTVGSVLYIAAHPDDENTRLLTYLSREKKYRTGYLSLTRGDGGQNLIGGEQGVELGLIRTQELLAARRIDGAEQFFTRAFDFGFSKNPEEAFRFWDKQKILADVVFIIRKFRPDVIITRFPTTGEGGHGHHTASAILAEEAFDIAGDPSKFPEQLAFVQPWQPKRLLWNTFNFGSANTIRDDQFRLDVGQFNPLLGKSYGEISAESRSQHKSQGFGVSASRGQSYEHFKTIRGSNPENDLFDGIATNWTRIPGQNGIAKKIDNAIAGYDPLHPEKSVSTLIDIRKSIAGIPDVYWKEQKLKEADRIIAAMAGMWLGASVSQPFVVPDEKVRIQVSVIKQLPSPDWKLLNVTIGKTDTTINEVLADNIGKQVIFDQRIDTGDVYTQPYWLAHAMSQGYFDVREQDKIGMPQNNPALNATVTLGVAGEKITYETPVMYRYTDPVKGEIYQPLQIVPDVQVKLEPGILLFKKGDKQTQRVEIQLKANRDLRENGLALSSARNGITRQFATSGRPLAKGSTRSFDLVVAPPANGKPIESLSVFASEKNSKVFAQDKVEIAYDHIPVQHYFYADSVKILNIDLQTAGKRIGYIPGAGDKVPEALVQMGYEVVMLEEKDLYEAKLKSFDAIITGVRAYNVHDFLSTHYDVLMNYVKEGGNLIVQYNTNSRIGPLGSRMAPYPFTITRNRVTDETADVQFLKKDHRVLNYPNKISATDFEGWVQERGIYFAGDLAPEYETIFSMRDPGEPAQTGSLIVAPYGKGSFVYTGLVFFRELPAGVPGAYRLLANLIALNQKRIF